MRIVVLVGGIGGAKFLLGVKQYLGWQAYGPVPATFGAPPEGLPWQYPSSGPTSEVTAIVNTADDIRLHNLQICPDLDSCMYTLAGVSDRQRGWGRADETWTVSAELAGYGAEAPWFSLGDRDIATHLVRTRMLDAGYPLSDVTRALCDRWQPGVTLLPMTDSRVETHVVVAVSDIVPKMSEMQDYGGFSNPRLIYNLGHAAFEFMESKWGKEGVRAYVFALRRSRDRRQRRRLPRSVPESRRKNGTSSSTAT